VDCPRFTFQNTQLAEVIEPGDEESSVLSLAHRPESASKHVHEAQHGLPTPSILLHLPLLHPPDMQITVDLNSAHGMETGVDAELALRRLSEGYHLSFVGQHRQVVLPGCYLRMLGGKGGYPSRG
jgi:hypothetical protein